MMAQQTDRWVCFYQSTPLQSLCLEQFLNQQCKTTTQQQHASNGKTLCHILSSVRYTLLSVKLQYSTMEYTSQAGVHNYGIIITNLLLT